MLSDAIKENADKYKIDKNILTALIATESGFNANAIRYEPDYRYIYSHRECAKMVGCTLDTMMIMQKTSWGLCQLMGAVYYEMQGKNWATILLDPVINIKFCGEYLRKLIDSQYLSSPADMYASYNAGSVRHLKDGRLVNQGNVDRFKKHYDDLKQFNS